MAGLVENALCTFDVNKELRIRSCTCGVFYRLFQLGIIGVYAIGYGVFYNEAYLMFDYVESATLTRMRGVVYTDFPNITGLADRIWDAADYVVPPLENGAKFIMTNIVVTRQTQGTCEEDPSLEEARCDNTTCVPGDQVENGHGILTGVCLNSSRLDGAKVCEVRAWCPVEQDDNTTRTPTPAFVDSKNFSLFVKNSVHFPKFGLRGRNFRDEVTASEYISSCRYNPDHEQDKHCPVFGLEDIVRHAGHSYEDIAVEGGVFQIIISWTCEESKIEDCWPTYSFRRLDREDHQVFRGFHFRWERFLTQDFLQEVVCQRDPSVVNGLILKHRFADHWEDGDGTLVRTLYKATGIRLVITVDGYCSRPDVWHGIIAFGSCLGALTVATLVCEKLVHFFGTHFYKREKYSEYPDTDACENINGVRGCGTAVGRKLCCSFSSSAASHHAGPSSPEPPASPPDQSLPLASGSQQPSRNSPESQTSPARPQESPLSEKEKTVSTSQTSSQQMSVDIKNLSAQFTR